MAGVEALKRYLEEHKITQVAFAKDMDVSQGTVSDWLNGNIEPSISKLRKMSARTGMTIDELVGNAPAPKSSSRERRATP